VVEPVVELLLAGSGVLSFFLQEVKNKTETKIKTEKFLI
jgi:hypothetical protein